MRNQRLLVIGLLIAVAVVWLLVVLPRPHADAPPRGVVADTAKPAAPAAKPALLTTAAAPIDAPPPTPPGKAVADPPAAEPEPESETEAASEAAPDPEPMSKVPAADADVATDLFAEQIAKQEAEPEEGHLPNAARDLWKRFDKEQADRDWADAAEKHLQETLTAWIAALGEGSNEHLVLVHVECRATLCQVLAADNDLDGQNARAESGQEWQQAIASLPQQSWWPAAGFTDLTTQVSTNEGYVLYTTYLLRAATPAAS